MARPKGGLGRGLGALIPGADQSGPGDTESIGLAQVRVDEIAPNPWQPRRAMDEAALRELADSIREHGLIQPLVLARATDLGSSAHYTLIAGERRWHAARLAGLEVVPAIVKDVTSQEMLELALVENLQRADLNALEEALAFRQLMDEFGLTQQQVADRVGKSRVAVTNSVRLLRLPEDIKSRLASGEISEGHARALLQLDDVDGQRRLVRAILERALSVRQTEELVRRAADPPQPKQADDEGTPLSPERRALESQFRDALGTKVRLVQGKGGTGRLIVQFFSEEELQSIYDIVMRGRSGR